MQTSITACAVSLEPRRLTDSDRAAVRAHLLGLSDDDRQLRFCQQMSDAALRAYADRIDFAAEVCLGVFDDAGRLVAFAQGFAYDSRGVNTLEAAFSTDAGWRRRGLAALLLAELTDHALRLGVGRVIALCLAANHPMRALLRAVGAACTVDDGEVLGELRLARAA